ncbi:hypothetical protein BH11PLA2_BH11PLA2_21450 [soil metagenome]
MNIPLRRWVGLGVLAAVAFLAFGFVIMFVTRTREQAAKVTCQNNLRALALLGTPYTRGDSGLVLPAKNSKSAASVWAGTVMNDKLQPHQRLSWVVEALPMLLEPSVDTAKLLQSIDKSKAWEQSPNLEASQRLLRTLQCPASPVLPAPGQPAVTMYVGISGVGKNSALFPLTEPLSNRAGAFRYDSATPLAVISAHDGLSQTLLFGQTTSDLGPWMQGGLSTVRGLEDIEGAKPLIGVGGQFGGTIAGGCWFALCDGSVRFFRTTTEPKVLYALATIAGGKTEFALDE